MAPCRTTPMERDGPSLPSSLPALMFGCARAWGNRPAFRFWRDGAWHRMDWASFAGAAANLARALRAAGITAGDRVLLVSENRPEVVIAETALMAIRAVPVPAYVTNTPSDHAHLLRDSGARAAIVSSQALADSVRAAAGARTSEAAHARIACARWPTRPMRSIIVMARPAI